MFLIILLASAFIYKDISTQSDLALKGYKIDTIAENLNVPWQIAFLPDSTMIFTEREGRVRIYRNNHLIARPAFNANDVVLNNKTGLLGICIHPDFKQNRFIYLASNYLLGERMKLKIVRFQLYNDTLINPFILFKDIPANKNHTGCRLIFGPDKKLYISTGDADQPMLAQDLKAYNGKILRVNDDGSSPADNPFIRNDTALKEIWSYGHRNPQGLSFQRETGYLYSSEHGPTGGDEVNWIRKGKNYGWPVIHHKDIKEGMILPMIEYTPSIGPSEALFYYGKAFPQLQGSLLLASLRGETIFILKVNNDKIVSEKILLQKEYGRIRSLVTGPDGYIYFSTSQNDPPEGSTRPHYDMILRMRPTGNLRLMTKNINNTLNSNKTKSIRKLSAGQLYQQLCASCHGDKLQGTVRAKGFIDKNFQFGGDRKSIVRNITNGIPEKGMPAWNGAISKDDIQNITNYILSKSNH